MGDPSRRPDFAKESKAKFDALLDAAVDAIIVIDERGIVAEANRAAERLFGYEREEIVGRPVDMLMPEPYRSEHGAYIRRYLETGERHIMGSGREVEAMKRSGEIFPVWLSVGEAVQGKRHFVGIVRDLSAQHAAERERHALEARLAHVGRFSLMGEMAAGIAHEINQPLAAIANYSQAAKRLFAAGSKDLGALEEACSGISDQAHRAAQVIENLRNFIRKQEVRKERLNLNRTIDGVMSLIVADAKAAGVEIDTELAEDLPDINGNAVQLQQVLVNLTHNAVDAMNSEISGEKRILIKTARLDDERVELVVKDYGTGVSPHLREAIFHPFVTTKRNGIGLGLAISQTIVRAHNGELKYADNPEGGAVFSVSLPIAEGS